MNLESATTLLEEERRLHRVRSTQHTCSPECRLASTHLSLTVEECRQSTGSCRAGGGGAQLEPARGGLGPGEQGEGQAQLLSCHLGSLERGHIESPGPEDDPGLALGHSLPEGGHVYPVQG